MLLNDWNRQLRAAVRATDDLPLMGFIDAENLLAGAANLDRHGQANTRCESGKVSLGENLLFSP